MPVILAKTAISGALSTGQRNHSKNVHRSWKDKQSLQMMEGNHLHNLQSKKSEILDNIKSIWKSQQRLQHVLLEYKNSHANSNKFQLAMFTRLCELWKNLFLENRM